jgi:hypothetical protein
VLLDKSSEPLIRVDAIKAFRKHFSNLVRLLAISNKEDDVAWRGARRLLDLREPPENGLGFGGSGRSGSSRPDEIREAILRTAKQIIELGSKDPEMISLMGLFESDVGPDTISDFTTRVIIDQLAEITEKFCNDHGIPVDTNDFAPSRKLPKYTDLHGRDAFIVLVPKDIVRVLPIANDWSDIERAVSANAQIRQRVNSFLAGLMRPNKDDRKRAVRSVVLSSAEIFEMFLRAVKAEAANYDANADAFGYYKLKEILSKNLYALTSAQAYRLQQGPKEVLRVAMDAIAHFQHHVEKGNLWEELWIGDKPKRERAAQLIFYAIAECFCIANNVDISPEANMGGGPIDFKFSKGFKARVLVEMKRSKGQVRHGYETQLEIYKDASRTNYGIFVVLDFGDLGEPLNQILEIRKQRLAAGEPASEIIVIDARRKQSASKRMPAAAHKTPAKTKSAKRAAKKK